MSTLTTRTAPVELAEVAVERPTRVTVATLAFWGALTGVAGMLLFDLFTNLGAWNIANWDESRHAVSAYEMLQRGDWIGNTWRSQLDYWNLKPPLSLWAEMLSYQVFGFTPFAFRLPAVIATILTVAAVAFFAHRIAGRIAAVVSALALTTASHFLLTHNARTGDPDALFILGTTVALLAFVAAPRHPRLLLLATSAVSFAFLAKSFHVALLLVFAAVYLLIVRRHSRVRLRSVAISLLGFSPVAAWAAIRYAYDGTAFLGNMFLVDVLHRTETPAEGNAANIRYYSKLILDSYWMWLAVLVGASIVCVVVWRRSGRRVDVPSATVFVALGAWALAVVGVFSLMATKLAWYALAAYPAMAVMIGIVVAVALRRAGPMRAAALVAGTLCATALAQAPIAAYVTHPVPDAAQSVLLSLQRDPRFVGRAVYTGPTIGWSQGLIAAAELGGGLRPSDGGPDAAAADSGALLLLPSVSPTAAGLSGAAIESGGGYLLVPARSLAG